MAKRRSTKDKYVSKGERRSSMGTSTKSAAARIINQQAAHLAGKRVMVTIPNPNKNETNKRFIRVPSTSVWKDPKQLSSFKMR